MDKLIARIAALGVPGLVLLIAMSATGLAGGAAITSALAAIGFGAGMLPGLVVLGLAGLIAHGIAEYGFDAVYAGVVKELGKQGITKAEILQKIDGYPISKNLKRTLRETVEKQPH